MSVHLDRSATGGYAWGGCTPTDPNFYRAYHHRSEHPQYPHITELLPCVPPHIRILLVPPLIRTFTVRTTTDPDKAPPPHNRTFTVRTPTHPHIAGTPTDPNFYRAYHHRSEHAQYPHRSECLHCVPPHIRTHPHRSELRSQIPPQIWTFPKIKSQPTRTAAQER